MAKQSQYSAIFYLYISQNITSNKINDNERKKYPEKHTSSLHKKDTTLLRLQQPALLKKIPKIKPTQPITTFPIYSSPKIPPSGAHSACSPSPSFFLIISWWILISAPPHIRVYNWWSNRFFINKNETNAQSTRGLDKKHKRKDLRVNGRIQAS